jgi:hypothetical protein
VAPPISNKPDHGSFLVLSRASAEWRCGVVPALMLMTGCLGAFLLSAPLSSIAAVLAVLGVFAFMVPGRLSVGRNGIALRWLWTLRTVPLDEIELVTRYEERVSWVVGLRLDLRSGRVVFVPMRMPLGMRLFYRLLPGRAWGGPDVELARVAIEYAAEAHATRMGAARPGESA